MHVLNSACIATSPLLIPDSGNWCKEQVNLSKCRPARISAQFQPAVAPVGFGLQLQPIDKRRIRSAVAYASASGQTQTVTKQAPTITITNAPASPKLDDGGTGFPPRDDDGGGGGGGGGGGNWSGGFFLFGFLAFLGFLKDKESEENYQDNRRR
ncbi:protein YELLOW LEAF 1, choloroplastic-like isoform X1 [Mangifera indica]|uniref:protein YELLOW LEAF 1, choloroplastic-like isoform X1 n=1 Tax=Mangifera indica TaxID=29780 RepID=UPI001CFAE282|nr:protein YELLOW LEAF 1, choloroplastic-like isoform X1 [Mangifera indica]XP_044473660.1 protein YELLOW LEAF 1, choloroplastic-like isoform X1 [Mangifera indica]